MLEIIEQIPTVAVYTHLSFLFFYFFHHQNYPTAKAHVTHRINGVCEARENAVSRFRPRETLRQHCADRVGMGKYDRAGPALGYRHLRRNSK